jgi:hypothetical protein
MSNMLEQAIIDAKMLREAAVKNAESAIVEKYSDEVKTAVEKLLEQEDDDLGLDVSDDLGTEETPDESSAMEQVPMAHISEDEEVVVVDLDDIVAAASEDPEEEDFSLDREEIADEVGISLDDTSEAPANRDDEVDLDDAELVNLFQELLRVDVPPIELEQSAENVEEEDKEETMEKEMFHSDGMNQDDIDEHYRNMAKFENIQRQNKKLKKTVFKLKEKLEQINLHNARLLYTNRVLSTASLNEQQKKRIVDVVKSAGSVEEAKVIYETLQKTMAAGSSNDSRSKSLSETISRPSSVILASRSRDAEPSGPNPTINRWATLAGLKNNK